MLVSLLFLSQKFQEARLRHDHHVRKGRRESVKCQCGKAACWCDGPKGSRLHMRQFVQPLCQSDLIEYLERRRVNRVAAKIAIEVSVRLEQCHRDAGA